MDIAAIASSLNVLGLVVFGFLVKGMKERIDNLTALAKEQKETLEAVRTRATELDQLRKDYRQGLADYQDLGNKLNELRAEVVKELEQAVKSRDEKLAQTKQRELESLDRIPELENRLEETIEELGRQVTVIASTSGMKGFAVLLPSPSLLESACDDPWIRLTTRANLHLLKRDYRSALNRLVNVKLSDKKEPLPEDGEVKVPPQED